MKDWFKWIFLALLLVGRTAWADDPTLAFARDAVRELSSTGSGDLPSKIKAYYDLDRLFERAAQDIRPSLQPEEERSLRAAFSSLLTQRLENHAKRMGQKGWSDLQYRRKSEDRETSIVSVSGLLKGRRVEMELTLEPRQGKLKIVDVAIEGALLSRNYRGAFNKLVRQEGAEGLEKNLLAQVSRR